MYSADWGWVAHPVQYIDLHVLQPDGWLKPLAGWVVEEVADMLLVIQIVCGMAYIMAREYGEDLSPMVCGGGPECALKL